jgi:RNA polymerase sigma-70 factor (ECF subfamily)
VGVVIDGVDTPEDGMDPVDVVGGLIQRTAQRDRDAFTQLYDMLAPRVFGLILRVLVDRAQSEEILQEVFLEVWQSADRFAPNRGQGRTWLLTIAHRRAIDRVRSAQAGTDRDVRAGLRELATPPGDVADQVALKIESERVAGALRTLPEVQREALVLAYYGGYSQTEIAMLTGAPLGTVKTRMRDGLTRLRAEMGVTR